MPTSRALFRKTSNSPHCAPGRFRAKGHYPDLGTTMAEAHHEAMTSHDFSDHKGTYEGFLRLTTIGMAWVLGIVATLGIGGTTGHWGIASFLLIVSTICTVLGLAVKSWSWKPGAVVVVLQLLTLLLLTR
jgi:Bacterial aa3 type cytochrome c oxidase subunit IV